MFSNEARLGVLERLAHDSFTKAVVWKWPGGMSLYFPDGVSACVERFSRSRTEERLARIPELTSALEDALDLDRR